MPKVAAADVQGDGDASGSDAEAGESQPALLVDDWLKLRVPQGRPPQLAVLRCRLAAAFAFKVCNQRHQPSMCRFTCCSGLGQVATQHD
jgi:hypothetical protein